MKGSKKNKLYYHKNSHCRLDNSNRPAYSLLEVQVALFVLMVGILGIATMLRTYSRQMETAQLWCRTDLNYYLTSQTNLWMKRLNAPAALNTEPGIEVWTPPVSGEKQYEVSLDSYEIDPNTRSASADLKLREL